MGEFCIVSEICPGARTRVVFCSIVVSVADLLLAK